jgi:hypothetical protein
MIKSFKQFLDEKWALDVKSISNESTPVFENPTSSDLAALSKAFIKRLRFIAIPKTQKLFVWDANAVLHLAMIQRLKAAGKITSDVDYEAPKTVFTGECNVEAGELMYVADPSNDINFSPSFTYANAGLKISKGVLPKGFGTPDTFEQELKQMCKDYSFVDRYIYSFSKRFTPADVLSLL